MRFLADSAHRCPRPSERPPSWSSTRDLRWAFEEDEPDLELIRQLLGEAATLTVPCDHAGPGVPPCAKTLERMAAGFRANPADLTLLAQLEQPIDLAVALPSRWTCGRRRTSILWPAERRLACTTVCRARQQGTRRRERMASAFPSRREARHPGGGAKKKIAESGRHPASAAMLDEMLTAPRSCATYRLQFNRDFTLRDARTSCRTCATWASATLRLADPARPGRQRARLRHMRPRPASTRNWAARRTSSASPRPCSARHGPDPRHRAQSHGHRRPAATAGGWTCWRTAPAPLTPTTSTSTGIRSSRTLENKVLLPVLERPVRQGAGEQASSSWRTRTGVSRLLLRAQLPDRARAPTASDLGRIRRTSLRNAGRRRRAACMELQSILTALELPAARAEPTPSARAAERHREKEVIKRPPGRAVRSRARRSARRSRQPLTTFNGRPRRAAQLRPAGCTARRPALSARPIWRVATEEINYRRFFDINDLAAIRVELPEVFRATHELHSSTCWPRARPPACASTTPTALESRRLFSPAAGTTCSTEFAAAAARRSPPEAAAQRGGAAPGGRACERPPARARWPLVRGGREDPRPTTSRCPDWAVHGTTGYDFLNAAQRPLRGPRRSATFDDIYASFIGQPDSTSPTGDQPSQKMIMLVSMASEINALGHQLDRISRAQPPLPRLHAQQPDLRHPRDHRLPAGLPHLHHRPRPAVAARPPVHRSRRSSEAKDRNPRTAEAIFDFVRDTLLLRNLAGLPRGRSARKCSTGP